MQEFTLFSRKIYTVGKNFTRPLVVTVATSLNSAGEVVVWSAMEMKTSQRGSKFEIFGLALWWTLCWEGGRLRGNGEENCHQFLKEAAVPRQQSGARKRREIGTRTSSLERSRSWELDLSSGNAWEDRIACITWNQTRFWFSIKFTYECCWKYSASFVLASGLFGACSASKEFLECTGIIIHHPWHLLILIPQFRIHKYKRQREPPASFPPSPSIKQISCTVNCC